MTRRGWLLACAALLALGVATLGYFQPLVLMQLSDQIWSCFG